ncbi:putative secreted protein (Por secretion system target) [Flavobacterium sp. 9]|uniref:T9SS type A sorting domain-containing protein n=1 Tax=Flavobacterium sp. 9 TaxID=2035198 RepID=UPI000C1A5BC6|nr:T9SS type A sorting domain-containing protein [Flavobacterium sp. 9]PIF33579.1 putative secreted protein (Por secretion system target) [Flavobacterium sp. 9]
MSKNYIPFIFLFFLSTLMFGQKVTITPLVVNGKSVASTSPINLESVDRSSVSLSVKIDSPIPVGTEGSLSIWFTKDNAITPVVAEGGFERITNFSGGNSATISFVITLSLSSFNVSGGSISAQYKSFSGIVYKSANVSVIKNGSTPTTPPVTPPTPPTAPNFKNTLCCDQDVRYGDRPAPMIASTIDPSKVSASWLKLVGGQFPNATYKGVNYSTNKYNVLITDYLTEPGTYKRRLGNDFPFNDSNPVNIRIIPSPITSNEISIEGAKDANGFIEITNTNPKSIYGNSRSTSGQVNLNILADPYHVAQRGDTYADLDRYEWQYTKTSQNDNSEYKIWITLANENGPVLEYFTPENMSTTDDNYFLVRRIAIYKDIQRVSNVLKIIPRTVKNNNIICCDQVLTEGASSIESPSLITGSTPSIENPNGANIQILNITYQWQNQTITTNTRPNVFGSWTNINGATSKDCLPVPLQYTIVNGPRGTSQTVQTIYNYRRIATITYRTINSNGNFSDAITKSYSNETSVKSGRDYGPATLIAYPNPASSIINVEYKGADYTLSNTNITVANTLGTIVNSNNFSTVSPNIISIDVSSLPIGTYFINVDTGLGSRRNGQVTFLKSN